MFGIIHAVASVAAADAAYLRSLSPERRAEVLVRRHMLRELEELEVEPEVQLARQYIADDGLRGLYAESLLEFARDLARRRRAL